MNLRANLLAASLIVVPLLLSQEPTNPWPASAIVEPADLAKTLQSGAKPPMIIATAFPVLYRSKHISRAIFAGPGSTPEGIQALKAAVQGVPKDSEIVIYCGCCPMEKCPNIRPSYKALRELGFSKIRVLSIPTNMATDWYAKGYPSEDGASK